MKKIFLTSIVIVTLCSGLLHAQNMTIGLMYSTNADFSSNVINENIVDYKSNSRVEVRFLYKELYAHLGWESLSFSENAVVYNSVINSISYINNPFNNYDLNFMNLGLGWQVQSQKWLRLVSGLNIGALVSSHVTINRNLMGNGITIDPLNNKFKKEDAINRIRLNIFQSFEFVYEMNDFMNLALAYKFEVPLLPLISNYDASPNFTMNNHASEQFLQIISLELQYRL